MGKLTGGNGEKKKKRTPTNLKYVIISRPTLPAAALMELIVLKNNKTGGKYACVQRGEMCGEQKEVPKPHRPPKSAAEVGRTEAVSKRGRIVFIWAEIKMEQLPWGRL